MAIVCGTLAQEVDGKVEYIYPKTLSSIVEYENSESVKDKIKNIDKNITDIDNRVTNIVSAVQYGSLGTKNDAELIDIRIPNYNVVSRSTEYNCAGDAIRGQFEEIIKMINDIKKDIEKIKIAIDI